MGGTLLDCALRTRTMINTIRLASRHSLRRTLHTTSTTFDDKPGFFKGLTNKLQNKVETTKTKTDEDQFQKTIDFMISSKTLTMDDFYNHLSSGLEELESSWKGKVAQRVQAEEIDQARQQTNIFAVMTKNERMKPHTIKRKEKIRIAHEAGVSVEVVNQSIRQFNESSMFHSWVQRRHKLGLSMPKNAAQSQKMFTQDKAGISSKKVNKMMGMGSKMHAR